MSTAPRSRPGRYAELTAGELADVVEHAYEQGDPADWELLFELAERVLLAAESAEQQSARLARPA